jgi:phosphoribosylformimino-5-aminoimidazole carboxamide ribotide isomerase
MRLLPVIDVLDGRAVRGIAGRRSEYRPLQSQWIDCADPCDVAGALRDVFGFRRFYLADLDGIVFQRPNCGLYRRLLNSDVELVLDAGVRTSEDARELLDLGVQEIVAALETSMSPGDLCALLARHGPERVVFSLDLKSGQPQFAAGSAWPPAADALSIADRAVDCGVTRMIVLDLADVGSGTGGSTQALCKNLGSLRPDLRLIAGGGIRGEADVRAWSELGIDELLVASALHDGRLAPDCIRHWQ